MKKEQRLLWTAMVVIALTLFACVTINIYFPAEKVESAAQDIVNDIRGNKPIEEDKQSSNLQGIRLGSGVPGSMGRPSLPRTMKLLYLPPRILAMQGSRRSSKALTKSSPRGTRVLLISVMGARMSTTPSMPSAEDASTTL